MTANLKSFPEIPLENWRATKNTLHLYLQIVGKIRLRTHPRVNQWWHVPLYVSPRGLTTRTIPFAGGNFEIEFDFKDHELKMRTSDGRSEDFALYDGLTVADFYASVLQTSQNWVLTRKSKQFHTKLRQRHHLPRTRKINLMTRNTSSDFIKFWLLSMMFSRNFGAASPANRHLCISFGTALTLL